MLDTINSFSVRISSALRDVLKQGYTRKDFNADLLAGIIIGIIAIPLSMALAIATGLPPQHGLYTAIIGGFVIALLGGSRTQVSGPTAAFVVILAPIGVRFGMGGLMLATVMAGLFLILFGLLQMGRLIQFIPYTVTVGFTAGIAVVLATLQIKDFLGLTTAPLPDEYVGRAIALAEAFPTIKLPDVTIGLLTLAILLMWPHISKKIPGPLIALTTAALAALALKWFSADFTVATINSQFSTVIDGKTIAGIPRLPPIPAWPWSFPGPGGKPLVVNFALLRDLAPPALAIAMLGAIESLLSAVIADGMTGTQHDPNNELVAQGAGNVIAPFFGGFAATGAIARTATNIRSGAKSPIAAIIHSLFILLAIVAFAPLLGYLPMASLAALLMIVAWNMSDAKHLVRLLRIAPRSDVALLLVCFFLTVFFDMVIAVTVGVLLAALMFMRRMAEVSEVNLISPPKHHRSRPVPRGILVYQIQGPLFFGAAQKAMNQLHIVQNSIHTVIIDLESVPVLDATGLINLESAVTRLREDDIVIYFVNAQPQPQKTLLKIGWQTTDPNVIVSATFDEAFDHTINRLTANPHNI